MEEPEVIIPATVSSHLRKRAQELADEFTEEVTGNIKIGSSFNGRPIISPVEQLFLIEWEYYRKSSYSSLFDLEPQHQDKTTGDHFIDFAVNFELGAYPVFHHALTLDQFRAVPPPMLGVEIDSHIWHEKTKTQVQKDKKRERFLIKNGWTLLRFTGSEVYEDTRKYFHEFLIIARDMSMKYHAELQLLIE